MVQGALKGKDESGKVGVPRGHPGERGPWGQEEEGCTEERVQEGGGGTSLQNTLGWNKSEQGVLFYFLGREATWFGSSFHLVVLLLDKGCPWRSASCSLAVIRQTGSLGLWGELGLATTWTRFSVLTLISNILSLVNQCVLITISF